MPEDKKKRAVILVEENDMLDGKSCYFLHSKKNLLVGEVLIRQIFDLTDSVEMLDLSLGETYIQYTKINSSALVNKEDVCKCGALLTDHRGGKK